MPSFFEEFLNSFLSLDPLMQVLVVVVAAVLLFALLRFAFHIVFRILAIGCAIFVVIGLIWAIYHFLLQ